MGSQMTDNTEVEKTRQELHEAVQRHMQAVYGPVVTLDWIVMAENVAEDDTRVLHAAFSEAATPWKVLGMAYQGLQHILTLA